MFFTKMEGLGNDYIYLNCMEKKPDDLSRLAREVSRRRFGIGADGVICICPSQQGDFCMEMYNADGSQGEMCGNGIRCLGKYVYDKGLTEKKTLIVETGCGLRELRLHRDETGCVTEVTVNMGRPENFSRRNYTIDETSFFGTSVSMGNPHLVLLWEGLAVAPVERIGKQLEHHPDFPNRTNVEFITVPTRDRIDMRVWERGSGETFACGTGACAAFSVAHRMGLCEDSVTVCLTGGELYIKWQDGDIYMRGSACTVFEGEINYR